MRPASEVGSMPFVFSFFFFQADDGIRDRNVTGVQTCALPIYGLPWCISTAARCPLRQTRPLTPPTTPTCTRACPRSEERRVGKEGRSGTAASPGNRRSEDEQRANVAGRA